MAAGSGIDLDDTGQIAGTRYVVNKMLADRVNRLIAEAPPDIRGDLQHAISSGYRDYAKQLAAYEHYLAGGGLAAPPGHSWHERDHGLAVDWNNITPRAWPYLKDAAYRYGLGFPLGSRDPYHMQMLETYPGAPGRAAFLEGTGRDIKEIASDARSQREVSIPLRTEIAPPLPIKPINQVPMIGGTAASAPSSVVVKPVPLTPPPPVYRMPRVGVPRAPNLASGFANALRTIFRSG